MNINTNSWSPKNDYLFKKLFSSKGNEDILCDFISAIIGRKVVHATIQMEKMLQQEKHIVDELNRREVIINELRFHYIELPKFRKSNPDMREKLNQWLAFIDDQNEEWISMAKDFNESVSKAMDEFDRLVAKEAEKYTEAGKERFLRDMASVKYNTFHKGLNEGIQKGVEQGIKQGIKQGMQEGIKQGLEEGKAQGQEKTQHSLIINMIKKGLDISLIKEITGVKKEKILQIKENIDKTL